MPDLSLAKLATAERLPKDLLLEILEHLPVPVVSYGPDDVLALNSKARSLWHVTDAEPSSLPVTVHGMSQCFLSLLHSQTAGAEPVAGFRVQVPTGEAYAVDTMSWEGGADSATWRVALLRPLDHGSARDELFTDKVDRLKAIVHEFRNTLTAAREALAFLQEDAVGELNTEQRRFLKSAIEDLENLIRTTVDLASLWVTRGGVLRIFARPVDIRRVVEQTTLCVQPSAERRRVSLQVEINSPLPVLIGDHNLLVQALRNVLTNALRYTPAGGEIRVCAKVIDATQDRAAGDGVAIEVQDSGTGIAPSDLERIFQPFERGSLEASGAGLRGSGMGLGLSIARHIASTHGGTLDVESVLSRGSRFVFRFPKHGNSPRSWMVRATQRAIDDVRPLGAPIAGVLLRFEAGAGDVDGETKGRGAATPASPEAQGGNSDLLSALQQIAIKNLRSVDTVLAIEGQLLLLVRGSTRSAAYAMVDRVLHSVVAMGRTGPMSFSEYSMTFGVAAYPEDGDSGEAILARAEAELNAFQKEDGTPARMNSAAP